MDNDGERTSFVVRLMHGWARLQAAQANSSGAVSLG